MVVNHDHGQVGRQDQVVNLVGGLRVKRGCALIDQQEVAVVQKGSGQFNPLLFTARQVGPVFLDDRV